MEPGKSETELYLEQAGFVGLNPSQPDTLASTKATQPSQDSVEPLAEISSWQSVEESLREFRLPDDL